MKNIQNSLMSSEMKSLNMLINILVHFINSEKQHEGFLKFLSFSTAINIKNTIKPNKILWIINYNKPRKIKKISGFSEKL